MSKFTFPTIQSLRELLQNRDSRVRASRLGDDWVGG